MRAMVSALAVFVAAEVLALDGGSDIVAGDNFPFARAGIPEDVPRSADADLTPGSFDWYREIEDISFPTNWRTVVHGGAGMVFDVTKGVNTNLNVRVGNWCYDEDAEMTGVSLDLSNVAPSVDPVRVPFDEGLSSVRFSARIDGTNYVFWSEPLGGYTGVPTSTHYQNVYPLYRPKAHRVTKDLYAAFLASFNAYYERLYYGSQGCRNEWDEDEWGPTGASDRFWWNLTNSTTIVDCHYVMPTNVWTHRIHGIEDMRGFMAAITNMGPFNTEACLDPRNAGCFIYRPGWLLDVESTGWPKLWWATSLNPTNDPGRVGYGLFPEYDWEENPFAWSKVDSQHFENFSITLDNLEPDEVAHTSIYSQPCYYLVESAIEAMRSSGGSWGQMSMFRNFEYGMGMKDYLKLVYGQSAHEAFDGDVSKEIYDENVWGPAATTARLSPYHFVGINQVLALMDRTIHIPDLFFTNVSNYVSYEGRGKYEGDLGCRARYDSESGGYELESEIRGTISATGEREVDAGRTEGPGEQSEAIKSEISRLYRTPGKASVSALHGFPVRIYDQDIYYKWFGERGRIYFYGRPYWPDSGGNPHKLAWRAADEEQQIVDVGLLEGSGDYREYESEIDANLAVSSKLDFGYEYDYDEPVSAVVSLAQPHEDALDRVRSASFSILSLLDLESEDDNDYLVKSNVYGYRSGNELGDTVKDIASGIARDVPGRISAVAGFNPIVPASFPIPETCSVYVPKSTEIFEISRSVKLITKQMWSDVSFTNIDVSVYCSTNAEVDAKWTEERELLVPCASTNVSFDCTFVTNLTLAGTREFWYDEGGRMTNEVDNRFEFYSGWTEQTNVTIRDVMVYTNATVEFEFETNIFVETTFSTNLLVEFVGSTNFDYNVSVNTNFTRVLGGKTDVFVDLTKDVEGYDVDYIRTETELFTVDTVDIYHYHGGSNETEVNSWVTTNSASWLDWETVDLHFTGSTNVTVESVLQTNMTLTAYGSTNISVSAGSRYYDTVEPFAVYIPFDRSWDYKFKDGAFFCYSNPFTGVIEEEQHLWVEDEEWRDYNYIDIATAIVEFGVDTNVVQVTAGESAEVNAAKSVLVPKIMTQVDWKWKSLPRDDP